MSKKRNSISDFRGAGKLAIDAVNGVIDIVEAVHYNISSLGGLLGNGKNQRTSGITGMVYKNIRSITGLAGEGIDVFLEKLSGIVNEKEPSPEQEAILSALNGVIGDHLEKTRNPLAIPMHLRIGGKPIENASLLTSERNVVLLIHGSCMNDLQWSREGHNHGTALNKDLSYEPIYLHYNSGRHISENGRELTALLHSFFSTLPEQMNLMILAHSMGGLVARSACHYAKLSGHPWLKQIQKIIFLGTPHHGAPLEQTGNWIDNMLETNPFSAPISRLGKLRSAGITDLRYGNVIDEDWKDKDRFESTGDQRTLVPLPPQIPCFTIAATIAGGSSKIGDDLIGDGLVPLYSALGKHKKPSFNLSFPPDHQYIVRNAQHLDLLNHPDVYTKISGWLQS